MTGWMILLIVLLALLILLFLPIVVTVNFAEEWEIKLRYLAIPWRLMPQKEKNVEKKSKTEKTEPAPQKKENKFRLLLKEKGLTGFLHLMGETAAVAEGLMKKLFSHIKIYFLSGNIIIGGDDAAETAITYGKACSIIYPAVSTIATVTKCGKYAISVVPDFNAESSRVLFQARFGIRPIFLLTFAFSALKQVIILMKKRRTKSPDVPEKADPQKKEAI